MGDAFALNELLNLKFGNTPTLSFKTIRPKRLTPLFCMAAETLEGIAPYLRDAGISDIIDADIKVVAHWGQISLQWIIHCCNNLANEIRALASCVQRVYWTND